MRTAAALLSALALTACATMPTERGDVVGTADLRFADGRSAGTATLVETDGELMLDVSASGLPSGPRGIHLHTVGACVAPDFQSAGAHLNPFNRDHGLADADGAHLGDLPNIDIAASGTTRARFQVADDAQAVLPLIFDADGTALIIHAQADDNVTDPSGNAGARLVCGEMMRS